MGLTVSPYVLAMDIVLLIVLGYAAFYALLRVSTYGEPLRGFILVTAVSLFLATFGRLLDIIDDILPVPRYVYTAEEALYFLSILGVIYGLLNYIRNIEGRLFPQVSSGSFSGSPNTGAFVFTGDREELFDFVASAAFPVLVFTRDPKRYSSLKHVKSVWVTQASEEGVGPTRLHLLLDIAVNFLKAGGRLVVVECVEVLVVYNDFPSVFRFLTTLKDYVLSAQASLLLYLDRESFEEQQFRLIIREFELIENLKRLLKTSS